MVWKDGKTYTMSDDDKDQIYKATVPVDGTSIMVLRIPVKGGSEQWGSSVDALLGMEYLVWTENKLGVNDRLAVLQLLNSASGAGYSGQATEGNTFFLDKESFANVSGEQWRWNWNKITYDSNKNEFAFEGAYPWEIKTFTYSNATDDDIEIRVVNKYVENAIPLDLMKYGSGDNNLAGAKFKLEYRKETPDEKDPSKTNYSWELCKDAKKASTVEDGIYEIDNGSTPDFDNIKSGIYRLTEVEAPTGFVLLTEKIYFQVKEREVKLVSYNEKDDTVTEISDGTKDDTWWLDKIKDIDTFQINIRNIALYDLPSTGGIGIYWYMIGGVLLMMAAALVYITNRRRGVLNG